MRQKAWLPIGIVLVILTLIAVGVIYSRNLSSPTAEEAPLPVPSVATLPSDAPSPIPDASPAPLPSSHPSPDLTVDSSGLSRATVVLVTSNGTIRFKLYTESAPNTVKRIVELASQGFYNGLVWHRVEPGFVIQTGDPQGTGRGGSGQFLKAEFNDRRHIEGTVAMARKAEPDSADSQFGQVISGMDVAKRIQVGDKIVSLVVE
jgi:cyclophilin family peptidyl-prolyl cis-trans isomerase